MIKYSIIIPTHNRPNLLCEALNSVADLKSAEIIVVENNSSAENISSYKKMKTRKNVNIFFKKFSSSFPMSEARNFGIKQASGEFIFFLDDDDQATTEFIDFLNDSPLLSKINRFSLKNGKHIDFNSSRVSRITFMDKVQPSTFLLHKSIMKIVQFREGLKYEDNHFAADLINEFGIKSQKKFKLISINYNNQTSSVMRAKHNFKDWNSSLSVGRYNDPFKFKLFISSCQFFAKDEIKLAWDTHFKHFKMWKSKMSPFYMMKYILWKYLRIWNIFK